MSLLLQKKLFKNLNYFAQISINCVKTPSGFLGVHFQFCHNEQFSDGDRVGIPWLGYTCGRCRFYRSARENLFAEARFTGYHLDGGYADYTVADQRYCFLISGDYSDAEAAPLLCAGLIGYRALTMAGDAERLVDTI